MAAALGYRPDGSAARLCFHLQQPSYDTERLIGVLDQLGRLYAGQRGCIHEGASCWHVPPCSLGKFAVSSPPPQARSVFTSIRTRPIVHMRVF
jgi:hypothetical protein